MQAVLTAMIKAYEIQGVLALDNAFNEIGLDHVILVKIASTAVVTHLLGGDLHEVINAVSQAFLDGQSLRTYRHAPNTASRKSWAAGDATARAVTLALFTLKGEPGYPSVLSAKTWGFNDVYLKGESLKISRPFDSYVIENILFKVAYPAEFHAQTAVEAALKLYPEIKKRLNQISKIDIETQSSAMRIINKQGDLKNPADRDHCLQYMVAVALLLGELTADSYSDTFAHLNQAQIDILRSKMNVSENLQISEDYYNPDKRAIGNAITVHFNDGTTLKEQIDYPLGHVRRRKEALPLLYAKAQENLSQNVFFLLQDVDRFTHTKVSDFCKIY